MADSLAPHVVEPLLRGRFGRPYLYAEVCASTQRLLASGAAEGTVAVTEEQREGRGRLGRAWHAPPRTSLLFSVVLRPPVEPTRLPELSLVAGGAVAEAVAAETGLAPCVEFPNDVLVGGRKVAGILAEATDRRVVLGVGVNVNQDEAQLPTRTDTPPTSLRLELGRRVERGRLLVAVLEQLERAYDDWTRSAGQIPACRPVISDAAAPQAAPTRSGASG